MCSREGGGDKYGAHWGLLGRRHLTGRMSVRMAVNAFLFQRLLKAVNGIQEEVRHSGCKRPAVKVITFARSDLMCPEERKSGTRPRTMFQINVIGSLKIISGHVRTYHVFSIPRWRN
jgi:hypothetical protein